LEIIRKLNIDECAAAEKIVEVYCRKEPAAARAWLKKEAAEFPAHLSSVVDAAERLLKPWHALDRLLVEISPDPQKIIRTAIACAQDNTARAFRELPDKLSAYPNARKRVFESCAEKRLWQTLEAFPSFRLALADIRPTLQRAFVQDPVRSLKASIEFLSQDPQLVRAGLRGAIRSNAAQSLELIRQTNLSVIECVPFLQQALRRNPRLLSEIPQQLVRHLNQDRHAMLIATACKGNIRRAIEILGDRSGCLRSDPELIVRACALENYSMALKTAPSPLKSTLTEPDFLRQLLGQAIVTGRWNSALHVSKLISGIQRDGRTATEEVSITEALLLLDGTLQSLDSRPDLSMEERENVRLMRVIREAHCIPTDNIQAVFDHFGEDDYRYLISVFERGGSSVAEAFFDTLHRVYPFESDISKLDQTIIDECLRHGFRGLSSEMLLRLRPIFEASPVRGKQAIQRYGEVAASILNGQEISAHVIEPSLFPALVHAAYRPVGMTVSAVADLLQTTTDHSAHLKALKYPVMGYPVRLETDAQVTLRNNTTLQQETFESIARILDIESSPSTTLTAPVLFKRMLEGGFDQIDIAAAWRVISSESNDERLPVLSKRILKGTQATAPLRQKLQSLAYARELFSVVARDALLARAEECMGSDASDRFRITPKLEAATRRILKMRADQPIGTDEIMAALDAQVEKLFKSLQYSLAREARKFMQSYEQVGDRYVLYLSKNRASYFGRAGAGLCTAQENWSWNQPTFLQMVMVDSVRGLVVGNIQLHLFKNERDENAVLARLNPTSSFLTVVSPATLAHEMLRTVQTFADENGLIPYLPVQTGWHELTNRDSFAPHLQRYAESQERASVRLTERKTVSHVLRMKQIT
jgi:hypothetical protein